MRVVVQKSFKNICLLAVIWLFAQACTWSKNPADVGRVVVRSKSSPPFWTSRTQAGSVWIDGNIFCAVAWDERRDLVLAINQSILGAKFNCAQRVANQMMRCLGSGSERNLSLIDINKVFLRHAQVEDIYFESVRQSLDSLSHTIFVLVSLPVSIWEKLIMSTSPLATVLTRYRAATGMSCRLGENI